MGEEEYPIYSESTKSVKIKYLWDVEKSVHNRKARNACTAKVLRTVLPNG